MLLIKQNYKENFGGRGQGASCYKYDENKMCSEQIPNGEKKFAHIKLERFIQIKYCSIIWGKLTLLHSGGSSSKVRGAPLHTQFFMHSLNEKINIVN